MQHRSGTSARHSIHVLSLTALSGFAALVLPTAADAAALDDAASGDLAICEKVAAAGTLFASNPNPILSAKPLRLAQAEAAQTEVPPAESEEDLVNELSDMLQACSYDGKAMQVSKTALSGPENKQGEEAVRAIMRFTGLPQNFTVVEANVPNAAAMIVLGPDKLPHRVIAYNARFIDEVRQATARNDWAPVSIMAHEIGHHLSGHTLMPGGSQPPVELEADKFSGFVLFKMGATLADAQEAIETLVPEADGPTHPGRSKRLAAVQSGWSESCDQQPNGCAEGEAVAASAPPVAAAPQSPAPASPAQPPATQAQAPQQTAAIELKIPGPADIRMPGTHPASKGDAVVPPDALDRVPRLDASATPSKFDRFVYDEIGVFHPQIKQELSQRAYAFAALHDLEIVTVVTKDLQGREPDRYALDLMRQLRVGKLEVGNGAVLVVAPNEKRVGVAMGPGLAVLYQNNDLVRRSLQRFLDTVEGGGRAQIASDLIVEASSTIMRNTVDWEWTVRYPSLESMMTAAKDYQARRLAGEAYDPARNPTYRKLVRLRATVVSKTPPKDDRNVEINAAKEKNTGPAMHVRDAQGRDAVLYVSASVPALMPSPLEEGREYAFVVRDTGLVAAASPQFDLVSYDLLR
ncbi:TPM domain-containing protein [Mesorhizobium sp. RP14(2022)]|uniref:TPM domain-containing protein n=1 Tax=Mesorhizobium liriopis TaxID=2953882 RepID=A0ABT1CAN4_9HYPH|nr:TPM domain-containing protein [Mesorhizobium liriopis]MCO6051889.1 TPM domain-containing protein [Mesorhizobium liriopis]